MVRRAGYGLCTLVCMLGCEGGDPSVTSPVLPGWEGDAAVELDGALPADAATGWTTAPVVLPSDFLALPRATPETSGLEPYDPPAVTPRFSALYQPARKVPALSGGTLAHSASGRVVVSDPDRDQLYVVDAALKEVRTVPLSLGQEPGRIATDGERAFVALRSAGLLVTVDLNAARVSATTQVCAAPRGVYFDTTGQRVLVACAGGDLVSVSSDGARVLAKTFIAPDLRDVGRDLQGLWVTQFRATNLLRLDAGLQETSRERPAEVDVASTLAPAGRHFSPTLAWRTVTGPGGEPLMLHQRAQTSTIQLGPAVGSDGVASNFSPYGGGPAANPREGSFCESGVVHTTLSRFGTTAPAALLTLPQAVVPIDLSISPDARQVAVVAPGNFVQDESSPAGSATTRQLFIASTASLTRVPGAPQQLDARDCLLSTAHTEHRFPGEAIAVAFIDTQTLLVQVRNPAELHVLRLDEHDAPRLTRVLSLSSVAMRDTGHEVFHQNTGTGIACASCHGEALDDGHVWSFTPGGPRRTQHLRGGVLTRAPFHWSADLPSLSALLDDVYVRRMGGIKLAPDARGALAGWIDATPLVAAEPGDTAAVARGRALFESSEVGCATCHAGAALAGSAPYDVGTGGSFKAPSLRGAALRLPLMHNGCADTLEKRFDPACGGSHHGNTAQLSAAQVADLVSYLRSL